MKNYFYFLAIMAMTLYSCTQGDVNTVLKGKTFVYEKGLPGSTDKRFTTKITYEFKKNGDVYYLSEVGKSTPFSTEGCSLYYKMDGNKFTIYYGKKGHVDEVVNTIFNTGEYFTDYIVIDEEKYFVQP